MAALLTACSSEELAGAQGAKQDAADDAVTFSVYSPRAISRAGTAAEMTTATVATTGFGILAYYTDNEKYDKENSKPDFMYNTKVTSTDAGTTWKYNPVMYWPNEYGSTAASDNIDYVSFFAYAPYVEVEPGSGIPYKNNNPSDGLVDENEKNITSISKNTASGDPIVKYVVDTEPATSVDLLWGVAANTTDYTSIVTGYTPVTTGMPFVNLTKPNNPTTGKLNFNLRHALSKLNINIRYAADETTTGTNTITPETRIYVRYIKIGGFVLKGALNLNNTAANVPNWRSYDGQSGLSSGDGVTLHDGRKDGKEGIEGGEQSSELPVALNPNIIENYSAAVETTPGSGIWTWGAAKTSGVTNTAVNLFGNGTDLATTPIFVIPTNEDIDIEICYDVETIDASLATLLSDGSTHGTSVENKIRKKSSEIFTGTTKMEAGKGYNISIILGMTSVKFEASVEGWTVGGIGGNTDVNLPGNN